MVTNNHIHSRTVAPIVISISSRDRLRGVSEVSDRRMTATDGWGGGGGGRGVILIIELYLFTHRIITFTLGTESNIQEYDKRNRKLSRY